MNNKSTNQNQRNKKIKQNSNKNINQDSVIHNIKDYSDRSEYVDQTSQTDRLKRSWTRVNHYNFELGLLNTDQSKRLNLDTNESFSAAESFNVDEEPTRSKLKDSFLPKFNSVRKTIFLDFFSIFLTRKTGAWISTKLGWLETISRQKARTSPSWSSLSKKGSRSS